jgi:hypothetical protein
MTDLVVAAQWRCGYSSDIAGMTASLRIIELASRAVAAVVKGEHAGAADVPGM